VEVDYKTLDIKDYYKGSSNQTKNRLIMHVERGDLTGLEVFNKDCYDYTLIAMEDNTVLFKIEKDKLEDFKDVVKHSLKDMIKLSSEIHSRITQNLTTTIKNHKVSYSVKSVAVRDNPFDKKEKEENQIIDAQCLVNEIRAENKNYKPVNKKFTCKITNPNQPNRPWSSVGTYNGTGTNNGTGNEGRSKSFGKARQSFVANQSEISKLSQPSNFRHSQTHRILDILDDNENESTQPKMLSKIRKLSHKYSQELLFNEKNVIKEDVELTNKTKSSKNSKENKEIR